MQRRNGRRIVDRARIGVAVAHWHCGGALPPLGMPQGAAMATVRVPGANTGAAFRSGP